MATNKDWKNWRKQTLAVRGGQRRTPFQETSEALFMTAGYAYEGAEEAEERDPDEVRTERRHVNALPGESVVGGSKVGPSARP
jgi:hypothetical protein